METEILHYIVSGLSVIAWTYFMIDRKTTAMRITKKGEEIDSLKNENIIMKIDLNTLKSQLLANQETEKLRTELLKQSLSSMEKSVGEIKGDMKTITETILKHLINNKNG